MRKNKRHLGLVYVLPFVHLGACFTIAVTGLGSGWEYLTAIDFPISVIIQRELWWHFPHALVLYATLGTLWWWFLSSVAELWIFRIIAAVTGRGGEKQDIDENDRYR